MWVTPPLINFDLGSDLNVWQKPCQKKLRF